METPSETRGEHHRRTMTGQQSSSPMCAPPRSAHCSLCRTMRQSSESLNNKAPHASQSSQSFAKSHGERRGGTVIATSPFRRRTYFGTAAAIADVVSVTSVGVSG